MPKFNFKVALGIVGQWLFIVNGIIKEIFNAIEMYDVIITNIMYWNKNIYSETDYWYPTEFASFFQMLESYHFNEHISSGIEKKVSVLSDTNRNFWAQLSKLKAIYHYQLKVQPSQKLSSKCSESDTNNTFWKKKHEINVNLVI